jgi:acyl carrier protein
MPTEIDQIIGIVCEVGQLPAIGPDDDVFDAGFSSVRSLELLIRLEDTFNLSIPDEQFISCRTARALCEVVTKNQQEGTS